VKVAFHVTGLIPPGKLTGTWNARPLMNFCPPTVGRTVVVHVPLKLVIAGEQPGQKVTVASGTFKVYGPPGALKVIV
jgi:hypothetical protein